MLSQLCGEWRCICEFEREKFDYNLQYNCSLKVPPFKMRVLRFEITLGEATIEI